MLVLLSSLMVATSETYATETLNHSYVDLSQARLVMVVTVYSATLISDLFIDIPDIQISNFVNS